MKLSIVTINKNNCQGLKKTIESVAIQTFADFEYIVVDGASSDDSVSVIEQEKQFIDKWVSEPDRGIYDAQNKGIAMAHGEYCLFLNSGDFFNRAATLEEVFKNPISEDIVYGDLLLVSPDGKKKCVTYPPVLEFDFLFAGTLPHQASFIKRDLLIAEGLYSLEYRFVSDWVFFIDSVFKRNCSYRHIDTVVTSYDTSGVTSGTAFAATVRAERLAHLRREYTNLCRGLENQDDYVAIRYCKRHRSSKSLRIAFTALSKLFAVYRKLKLSLA